MKKTLALLSLLISLFFCTSCMPEHPEPEGLVTVDFSIELSGVSVSGKTIYAVVGESLSVSGINSTTISQEPANFREASYFVDGYAVKSKSDNDTSFTFVDTGVGNHHLSIAAVMEREDLSKFGMAIDLPVVVVESVNDLPRFAPEMGNHTYTIRVKK